MGAAGLRKTLMFLVLLPLVWSAPLALMTAELSCLMPENGGHVVWIDRAFGKFLGSLNATSGFVCNVFDNALYPVLFVEYLDTLLYAEATESSPIAGWLAWGMKLMVLAMAAGFNLRGVQAVGDGSVMFTAYVLLPFVVMAAMAGARQAGYGDEDGAPEQLAAPPPGSEPVVSGRVERVAWGQFLAIMTWNLSGFDSAGACAGDVGTPGRVYPRALTISLLLLVLNYAVPTVSAAVVLPESEFSDGAFLIAADVLGSNWLRVWAGTGALVCSFGLAVTLLYTSSNAAYGMARLEHMPGALGRLWHGDTPYVAIVTNAVLSAAVLNMSFVTIAEVDMIFYSLSTILKFGALVRLRATEPDAPRPYRVPLGGTALALACVPPCLCCCFTIACAPHTALLAAAGVLVASAAVYFVRVRFLNHYRADRHAGAGGARAYSQLDQARGDFAGDFDAEIASSLARHAPVRKASLTIIADKDPLIELRRLKLGKERDGSREGEDSDGQLL